MVESYDQKIKTGRGEKEGMGCGLKNKMKRCACYDVIALVQVGGTRACPGTIAANSFNALRSETKT